MADTLLRVPATLHHPALHVRGQHAAQATADVLYVHGATFPSALSLFFRFDGRSWADALNDAGFDAWGFDFAGYGESERWPAMAGAADSAPPLGRAESAERQLADVVAAIRGRRAARPLHLLAHSWGSVAALRHAGTLGDELASLVLFGPIVPSRNAAAPSGAVGAWHELTVWQQYRRFIEDVPRRHPPLLADRHIEAWSRAWLATDADSARRMPPAVRVPAGPIADIAQMAQGGALYDASRVTAPVLVVRGAWDSVCDDHDAARLATLLSRTTCRHVKIDRGTHLMHLEAGRVELHRVVNRFLQDRP